MQINPLDYLPHSEREALDEAKRKWAAKLVKFRSKAAGAIATSNSQPQNSKAVARAVALLRKYSAMHSSRARLPALLPLLTRCGPSIFRPVLLSEWEACDATWSMQHELKEQLVAAHNMENVRKYLDDKAGGFFDALCNRVRVFRGSRSRIKGLSWTTDNAVAIGFARGHRNIPVPSPVVATALIPKNRIFFVALGRDEREIVLDPNFLLDLSWLRSLKSKDAA